MLKLNRTTKILLLIPLLICFLSVGLSSATVLRCSYYPLGGYESSTNSLTALHPSTNSLFSAFSQSFMTEFNDSTLNQIDLWALKSGAPVAIFRCHIYNASGNYGTTNVPDTLIETSTTDYQVSALGTTPTLISFAFADTTPLYAGTVYEIVITAYSKTTLDGSNYVRFCYDNTPNANDGNGNGGLYANSAWAYSATDYIYTVWGTNGQPAVYIGGDVYVDNHVATTDVTVEATSEFNNTVISAEGGSATAATPINYYNSAAIILLSIICIALTVKPSVPILNFCFGIITFGIAAATAGQTDMLLYGYIQILAVIMAIICMLSGYNSWKR